MTKFAGIIRRIEFAIFGEEWKDAYLRFHSFTYEEIGALAKIGKTPKEGDKAIRMLGEKFIDGMAPSKEGKLIKVKADDLGKLPLEVLVKSIEDLGKLENRKKE